MFLHLAVVLLASLKVKMCCKPLYLPYNGHNIRNLVKYGKWLDNQVWLLNGILALASIPVAHLQCDGNKWLAMKSTASILKFDTSKMQDLQGIDSCASKGSSAVAEHCAW
ncbi:hypothetical protein C8R48DRAFT_761011 [Suillus tomentosus]|nr:hypothetical protein C8R48DRAFT_761011 [Suillus tomentosus]